jgi:hypothetical protein
MPWLTADPSPTKQALGKTDGRFYKKIAAFPKTIQGDF